MELDAAWKTRVNTALIAQDPLEVNQGQQNRLARAMENLGKQHI